MTEEDNTTTRPTLSEPRLDDSPCSAILDRVTKHTRFVLPSTQYGMGFIITDSNKIVFRDDTLSHEQRRAITQEVNSHLPQNSREHPRA